jgi:hypothetical protein
MAFEKTKRREICGRFLARRMILARALRTEDPSRAGRGISSGIVTADCRDTPGLGWVAPGGGSN